MLETAERTLLARLCVFEGGASLEAFDAVCNPDGLAPAEALLASIMDKTLAAWSSRPASDAQPRLGDARHGARVRRRAGGGSELAELELRHARYFLDYAEHAAEQAARADRRVWLDRLALERGNLRRGVRAAAAGRRGRGRAADRDRVRARAAVGRARARGPRLARAGADELPPEPTRAARRRPCTGTAQLALSQARFDGRRGAARAGARGARAKLGDRALEAAALTALGRRAVLIADPAAAELCEAAVAVARRVGDPGAARRRAARARRRVRARPGLGAGRALADEALALYRERRRPVRRRRPRSASRATTTWSTGGWSGPSSGSARRSSCAASSATTAGSSSR